MRTNLVAAVALSVLSTLPLQATAWPTKELGAHDYAGNGHIAAVSSPRGGQAAGQDAGKDRDRDGSQQPGQDPGRNAGRESGVTPGQDAGQESGEYPGQYASQDNGMRTGQVGSQVDGRNIGSYSKFSGKGNGGHPVENYRQASGRIPNARAHTGVKSSGIPQTNRAYANSRNYITEDSDFQSSKDSNGKSDLGGKLSSGNDASGKLGMRLATAMYQEYDNIIHMPLNDFMSMRHSLLGRYDMTSDGCSVPFSGDKPVPVRRLRTRDSAETGADAELLKEFFGEENVPFRRLKRDSTPVETQYINEFFGDLLNDSSIVARSEELEAIKNAASSLWSDFKGSVQGAIKKFGNKPFGNDFGNACIRHDFGYRNAKKFPQQCPDLRSTIDGQFRQDMLDVCSSQGSDPDSDCYVLAYSYWLGVRVGGGFSAYSCDA